MSARDVDALFDASASIAGFMHAAMRLDRLTVGCFYPDSCYFAGYDNFETFVLAVDPCSHFA